MVPLKGWLKPPRSLLLSLFLVTLVSVSALGWFGWKLLDQERIVETQRAQERLEQAADRIAAKTRETLAETGERVGAWLLAPPSDGKSADGLLLTVNGDSIQAFPPQRLLYRPSATPLADPVSSNFADGEVLEFQQVQPQRAIEWYQKQADSKNDAIRAGALMRIARILRRDGKNREAAACYRQLAAIDSVSIAGVPASLLAEDALAELSERKADAEALRARLLNGRWPLTRSQLDFYWSEAQRLSGSQLALPSESEQFSEIAAQSWPTLIAEPSTRGQTTLRIDGQSFLLIWRGSQARRALLITRPESILKPVFQNENVSWSAVDADGATAAGKRDKTSRAVVRTPAETQLPWTFYFTGLQSSSDAGMIARQRYLMLVTALMAGFLIAGAFFIARAIRGDMEINRMQSDFVSAVSHEFRSPLTSIRQLSEILALGRVPGDDRRQVYYETLVRETTRLQRLVEGLLNFGRMEAGVRQYRFESTDAGAVVERVASEFESGIAAAGRRIELTPGPGECCIDADPEALTVAVRNLVDNALKYSPDRPAVWVEWGVENRHVAIRVRDEGAGIDASERRAIFRKFVRGSAAAAGNVKGSGVGLAMVRHIVTAHGGDIRVVSQPGQGSTFTILLPRKEFA
jgi:signal transduction histidine kinase